MRVCKVIFCESACLRAHVCISVWGFFFVCVGVSVHRMAGVGGGVQDFLEKAGELPKDG